MGEVLGEEVGGKPRVRGCRGGYSRGVTRLEMAYRGPTGQGES